jgi:hypothetical protein
MEEGLEVIYNDTIMVMVMVGKGTHRIEEEREKAVGGGAWRGKRLLAAEKKGRSLDAVSTKGPRNGAIGEEQERSARHKHKCPWT